MSIVAKCVYWTIWSESYNLPPVTSFLQTKLRIKAIQEKGLVLYDAKGEDINVFTGDRSFPFNSIDTLCNYTNVEIIMLM
jgi:hypothetical protein